MTSRVMPAADPLPRFTERGSPEYRRIVIALFLSGYATFSLLYCVQPVLPLLSLHFRLDAAQSALALSVATGLLAPSILLAGAISESTGRKPLMAGSLCSAALLNLMAAAAPSWDTLLLLRALEGLALGGAPAIAMTYLAEEIHPSGLGLAMGLYIGGTAIGGMAGRLVTGIAAQQFGFRGALAAIGLLGAASAIAFLLLLPASRNFRRQHRFDWHFHLESWRRHLSTPGLRALFAVGGLLMGSFVSLFNAASYRLSGPPYQLDQTQMGTVFVIYLLGTAGSTLAGSAVDRIGHKPVLGCALATALLGLLLTLLAPLATLILGLALFTIGFFAGHAVASGRVGRLAQGAKAHAASLYLLSYYLGSSALSVAGGVLWQHGGWRAVVAFSGALLLGALLLALLPTKAAGKALIAAPLILLPATAGQAQARDIPSPFLQEMTRAETPNASGPPVDMVPLLSIRIAGRPMQLGKTPIDLLARRLGVRLEHQGDAGDSLYWLCVRLDVPPGTRHLPRDQDAPTLWLVSDAEATGPSHAVTALALDGVQQEGRRCPVPARDVSLTLDARIARPGDDASWLGARYDRAPLRDGRSTYMLPGVEPDQGTLTLTVLMESNLVETSWLTTTPDN